MEETAQRLFDEATRGDREALEQLLQRYLPRLYAFVHARMGASLRARESSRDVVQSVCRELLEAGGGSDRRSEDRFRAWLFAAALNKVRERYRRMHADRRDAEREEPLPDQDAETLIAQLFTPSQEAIGNETAAAVSAALAALTDEHREVITLSRIVGLPHSIIAEAMSRSEAATRQLLARAMVQLVRELHRRGIDVERRTSP